MDCLYNYMTAAENSLDTRNNLKCYLDHTGSEQVYWRIEEHLLQLFSVHPVGASQQPSSVNASCEESTHSPSLVTF